MSDPAGIADIIRQLDEVLKLDRHDAECAKASSFPVNVDVKRAAYAERIVAARRLLGLKTDISTDGLLSGFKEAFKALQSEPSF